MSKNDKFWNMEEDRWARLGKNKRALLPDEPLCGNPEEIHQEVKIRGVRQAAKTLDFDSSSAGSIPAPLTKNER